MKEQEARERSLIYRKNAEAYYGRMHYASSPGEKAALHRQALGFERAADELLRTLGTEEAQAAADLDENEEIERLQRAVDIYQAENRELRKQIEGYELMRGLQPAVEVDRPGTLAAIQRMELDLGKCRAYLGSKVFDEVVTGKRAAPVEPAPRQPWDWNEMRRMR